MNDEHNNSAATSATTSTNEPNKPNAVNDSEFVREQAESAKAAIGQVVREMASDLKDGVDVRHWTQQYPLISLGVAIVAGFTAAAVIVPTKDQTWQEKFEALKDAIHPEPQPDHNGNAPKQPPEQPRPAKPSWTTELLREAAKSLGPALASVLGAAVSSRAPATPPSQPPQNPPTPS